MQNTYQITVNIEKTPFYRIGVKDGIQTGIQKGIENGVKKVALGMLKLNLKKGSDVEYLPIHISIFCHTHSSNSKPNPYSKKR